MTDINLMLGSWFQHEERNEDVEDIEKAFTKWKKTLTIKDVAFMYFTYWSIEPKFKEIKELNKIMEVKK